MATKPMYELTMKVGRKTHVLARHSAFERLAAALKRHGERLVRGSCDQNAQFFIQSPHEEDHGGKAVLAATFNGVFLAYKDGYRCDNCQFTAEEPLFPEADDLAERLDEGAVVSRHECPACGALAYPLELDEAALVMDAGEGGADYTLKPGHTGCWVTVGTKSVHIVRRGKDGVGVFVYDKGEEMERPAFEGEVAA
jgi:hypothetical protein